MALTHLKLVQFTAFEDAGFEFCPGINVLIGRNSTGKSHALKAAYSLIQGLNQAAAGNVSETKRDELVSERFKRVFLPDQLDRLIRRPSPEPGRGAELLLSMDAGDVVATLKGNIAKVSPNPVQPPPALFITSRDVLAFSEGFVRLYERRELSFDETYADLCRALEVSPLRQPPELLGRLESILGGKVVREGDRFYVRLGGEDFEAHLVGEGLRKIATLVQLLANGSLTKGSVLFWDEPEAGLNPQVIAAMAGFIRELAAWGVQIVVATHDYLLPSRLSVAAAGRIEPQVATRFFSLHRTGVNDPVEVEQGETLEELEHNPILKAHADFYDYKSELNGLE